MVYSLSHRAEEVWGKLEGLVFSLVGLAAVGQGRGWAGLGFVAVWEAVVWVWAGLGFAAVWGAVGEWALGGSRVEWRRG